MKIEKKIILSNVFNVALIVLIGIFAFQDMNLVLTKLRFVEIADDLNASFLEMRLSEKNYLLYKDETALSDIKEKIDETGRSINLVRKDITRAIGEDNLMELESYMKRYSKTVEDIRKGKTDKAVSEIRAEGKRLKEFSESISHLERKRISDIISISKKILFYSFWAILLSAIIGSHFISQRILRSLREIERLAKSISHGNFHRIEGIKTRDELDSVIEAINSMSEELSNREEQIIQSKKLASLGILTAGVAHELTNPINNISMIAQTYSELYLSLTEEQRIDFMKKINGETDRIKGIVKNLLDFSRPKDANLKQADINEVIQRTLTLIQNMIDVSNVDAKVTLEAGLQQVFVDENQIQQVLVNIITNALHAMPHGGSLLIFSRKGAKEGFIEIEVTDNGKGISPKYLPYIFDPFFTTKGEGGTGLGLSVSYGIIKNHKGDIRVESWAGEGTTFTIELPVYAKASDALIREEVK